LIFLDDFAIVVLESKKKKLKRDWKNWRGPSNLMKNGEFRSSFNCVWLPDW